jgi:hypothetical protein
MKMEDLKSNAELPLIIELDGLASEDFISYYKSNKDKIENELLKSGALKFRGVLIDSIETFQHITNSISDKFLNYIDGTSPRTKLSGTVYTSTEYDKTMRITMHNENSYSARWPNKLFFSCLRPADTGGETLLADSREMLRRINKNIVSEIRAKGIVYIRNLHGGQGMGISWQQAFEISDKRELEEYCRDASISFKWKDDDNVRLEQPGRGIIEHRGSKEEVWFNQIDQFHPYQLGEELCEAMMDIYGSPDNFPVYVKFGDGTPISEEIVKEIIKTYDEVTAVPRWMENELLIIDNELVSHGRNPYSGDRKVLLAMSK